MLRQDFWVIGGRELGPGYLELSPGFWAGEGGQEDAKTEEGHIVF